MARKRRSLQPIQAPAVGPKGAPRYQDPFQQTVGQRVEDIGKKLEGQGRNILYGVGALLVLGAIVLTFYLMSGRTNAAAQTALGKAIETSQALISQTSPPAGSSQKVFKSEKERAEAAIAEFQAIVDKFGGEPAQKAKYFMAVNRLVIDRPAAIQELQDLSKTDDEVGKLSKFALAQALAADGKLNEAGDIYKELAAMENPILSKETINYELATIYEKQGRPDLAVELLYDIALNATVAKDADGKPVPLTPIAQNAKDKLKELNPGKAAEIPDPNVDEDGIRTFNF